MMMRCDVCLKYINRKVCMCTCIQNVWKMSQCHCLTRWIPQIFIWQLIQPLLCSNVIYWAKMTDWHEKKRQKQKPVCGIVTPDPIIMWKWTSVSAWVCVGVFVCKRVWERYGERKRVSEWIALSGAVFPWGRVSLLRYRELLETGHTSCGNGVIISTIMA